MTAQSVHVNTRRECSPSMHTRKSVYFCELNISIKKLWVLFELCNVYTGI